MAVFMFLSISGWFREPPGIYPFPLLYARMNVLPFSHPSLFYRHALCQVSRLVDIQTFRHRYIITHQLQRNHCQ